MTRIDHPAAPFPTIDDALAAGHAELRVRYASEGAFPIGVVAEPQVGGYFVRIAYYVESRAHGRKSRKHRHQHSVEIGRIEDAQLGREEGDICRRDGCAGLIELIPDNSEGGGCSCFRAPPCGYCTSTMPECPACGWRDGNDD